MTHFFKLTLLFLLAFIFKSQGQKNADTVITIYFASGQNIASIKEIDRLLIILNSFDSVIIRQISGFADSVGSDEQNMILSGKRSEYISSFLQTQFHFDKNWLIKNYGEQQLASITDNSLNRRVEISIRIPGTISRISDTSKSYISQIYTLDKIYFKPDEPIIDPSSFPYLDNIANILLTYKNELFEIRGHVNWNVSLKSNVESGYRKKMYQLSTDRARAVYDILIDKGIPAQRMIYMGMGNSQMIYPNAKTIEEKQKNMRVEILILRLKN